MNVEFIAAIALAHPQPIVAMLSHPTPSPLPACTHGPTPAGTELMVVGLYEGETLSTAWVGDPDEATTLVSFPIAPGPPLHLVVSGYRQNVYRFSGATARIHRVTIMGHHPSAVEGLPRDRVEFAAACLTYRLFGAGVQGEEAARRQFDQTPVSVVADNSPFRIRIDARLHVDALPPPRSGTGESESDRLYQFSPGGIADVHPHQLVSTAPVGAYRTLPQEAGIRQLVRAGVLVPANELVTRAWQEQARRRGVIGDAAHGAWMRSAYRVMRPTTVPSGLCGAHSVEFFAPSPAYLSGDPCHSTFYFDDGTAAGPRAR